MAQGSRCHDLILGQPYLQLFMPPPVTGIPVEIRQLRSRGRTISLQFHGGLVLLDVTRTAVENPHQRLLVETLDFVLQRLHVRDIVALGEAEVGDGRSWRGVIELGQDLGR